MIWLENGLRWCTITISSTRKKEKKEQNKCIRSRVLNEIPQGWVGIEVERKEPEAVGGCRKE